jgi:hypothetical protein
MLILLLPQPSLLHQPSLLPQPSLLLFQLVMLDGVVMDLALTDMVDMVDMVILVMDMPVSQQLTPELMPSQPSPRLKKQTINVFFTGCHF